ncbi:hypothetical protein E2C01_088949 [Portunus trituberculatus]|uniref:Uncharacterized protein n=1 Tax=Portunus trituberculatus TaxID=210409 RepID=A0A5B7JKY9_PORTR|nr:hypothetical protein [Portunus trituberculatus]
MMKVTHKQKGHKKKKKRPSGCVSPASSRWCFQQPQSNLKATLSPSLQAFMDAISLQEVALTLLKNIVSSSRSARDRGGKPANHSETTTLGPSPGKFKPKKFAKTDVIARCVDFGSNFI